MTLPSPILAQRCLQLAERCLWFTLIRGLLPCSRRGAGRFVWGVYYQARGLWVPQGPVWVRGYPAVQQPAVLCYTSRTSDTCSFPHHGFRTWQGACWFYSSAIHVKCVHSCGITCVTLCVPTAARRGFWSPSAVLPHWHRRVQRSFPRCTNRSPNRHHGNQLHTLWSLNREI